MVKSSNLAKKFIPQSDKKYTKYDKVFVNANALFQLSGANYQYQYTWF